MRLVNADKLIDVITTDYYEHFTSCHTSSEIALLEMIIDDINELADKNDKIYILPHQDKPLKVVFQDNYIETFEDNDSFDFEIIRPLTEKEKEEFYNFLSEFNNYKYGNYELNETNDEKL